MPNMYFYHLERGSNCSLTCCLVGVKKSYSEKNGNVLADGAPTSGDMAKRMVPVHSACQIYVSTIWDGGLIVV